MAENETLDTQTQDLGTQEGQEQDVPPKTYTQEELDALLKDAEAKGYGKGKFDTNAKWEKTAKEREKQAKEEAEKQARFEKMSELEKAQTQAKETQEELVKLKDEIALNKQKDETRKIMKEKELPDAFLNAVLVPKDAEATLNNVIEFKALFDAEVQKQVEARISTHVPKQTKTDGYSGSVAEDDARRVLGLAKKV